MSKIKARPYGHIIVSNQELCKASLDFNVEHFNLTAEEKEQYKDNFLKLLNKKSTTCCICGKKINVNTEVWGNNPDPVISKKEFINASRCCDECNSKTVIPARARNLGLGLSPYYYSNEMVLNKKGA